MLLSWQREAKIWVGRSATETAYFSLFFIVLNPVLPQRLAHEITSGFPFNLNSFLFFKLHHHANAVSNNDQFANGPLVLHGLLNKTVAASWYTRLYWAAALCI